MSTKTQNLSTLIWNVADVLRGLYKESEYGEVILPFTVLRRLDSIVEENQELMKESYNEFKDYDFDTDGLERAMLGYINLEFFNISEFTFSKLIQNPDQIKENLEDYLNGFSNNVKDIFENFDLKKHIDFLEKNNLLFAVVQNFSNVDLSTDKVDQVEMGYIFEEILRKFSDTSGETAGEHFTPTEVIELITELLFVSDSKLLTESKFIRSIYDPTCGTGNMLAVAKDKITNYNKSNKPFIYGQEINPFSYAISKSYTLLNNTYSKDDVTSEIKLGNTLTEDKFASETFNYGISNPPFGTDWKSIQRIIKDEHETLGFKGRFGAGLPKVSDGSMLFLLHLLSKIKHDGRAGIVLSGSPLFSGGAGSGESEIRKWIIENDWLDAVIALPTDLFFNTSIGTYIWILDKDKPEHRKGKVQLINAVDYFVKMKKSKGSKRKEITEEQQKQIVSLYSDFVETKESKIFDGKEFGYTRVTVEQPLRVTTQVTEDGISKLKDEKAFAKLTETKKKGDAGQKEVEQGVQLQSQIVEVLNTFDSEFVYKSLNTFEKELKDKFKEKEIKVSAAVVKSIINALSEKDETAEVVLDSKNNVTADTDLRDTENIPLTTEIEKYFKEEIQPHVNDAWIDKSKNVVGYEIPFNRHFYEYQQLRSIEEVEKDIQELESDILALLKEVTK